VFVVDDDISVRESLELLIRSPAGSGTFVSAQEFCLATSSCSELLGTGRCLPDSMVSTCRSASPSIGLTCRLSSSPVTATCDDGQAMKAGRLSSDEAIRDEVLLRAIRNASSAVVLRSLTRRDTRVRESYASLSRANGRSWRWSSPAAE